MVQFHSIPYFVLCKSHQEMTIMIDELFVPVEERTNNSSEDSQREKDKKVMWYIVKDWLNLDYACWCW